MIARILTHEEPSRWNTFVSTHFPPVGAFLQSHEWGKFKEQFHHKGKRIVVEEGDEWLACFHLEIHELPLGLSYGYAPRGPVFHLTVQQSVAEMRKVFECLSEFLAKEFPKLSFVRFEPAYEDSLPFFREAPFAQPDYYLQPRFNQLVTLGSEEEMLATFSSDVKHDIRAAERLGITVSDTAHLTTEQVSQYEAMKHDTRERSQKNIFPSKEYFELMERAFTDTDTNTKDNHVKPEIRYFYASNKEGKPVAMNMNLLFGTTLTYLYGASYSGSISKRAPAYLHWKTMEYARENGFTYYDLGGVDDSLWHGLTYFKGQFGGRVLEYVGNVDLVLKTLAYKFYNFVKR